MNVIQYNGYEIPIEYKKGMKRINLYARWDTFTIKSNPICKPHQVKQFMDMKADWMNRHINRFQNDIQIIKDKIDTGNYQLREYDNYTLRRIIKCCVRRHENERGKVNRISINPSMERNWGTCSSKRNLTFNPNMKYLPRHLIEYIVYHEMCHLTVREHNKDFWALVEEQYPNRKEIDKEFAVYDYQTCRKQWEHKLNHCKFLDDMEKQNPQEEIEVIN